MAPPITTSAILFPAGRNLLDALRIIPALSIFLRKPEIPTIPSLPILISATYLKSKKIWRREKEFIGGLKLSKQNGTKENIKECYKGLAEMEEARGDYQKANEYYRLFSSYKDSLLNDYTTSRLRSWKPNMKPKKGRGHCPSQQREQN